MGRLDGAAVHLLETTGARIEHDRVLALLEGAGCRVDRATGRCRFPESLVRRVVADVGRPCATSYRGPATWRRHPVTGQGGSFPHLLEWPACQRRLATRRDVEDMAKMAHVLPEFTMAGSVLTCAEVDPRFEPVWNVVARMRLTDKPLGPGEVLYHQNIKHLVRLGEVATGEPGSIRLLPHGNFSIAPLRFSRREMDCALEKTRVRCPYVPGTMPIGGISGPVTIAGTVAICLAELLAGWVIGYVMDPALPAGGIVASGSLDMRTLAACFSSPEARLQNLATAQICRLIYGIPVVPALGYVDCKTPGIQAAAERMSLFMAWPLLAEVTVGAGGLLSAGQDYCPVQHLLDLDIVHGYERFLATFKVDEETLALDLTQAVAERAGGTFLDTDHTLKHYLEEQWYPRWLDRSAWQGDREEARMEADMLSRIDRYYRDAIARYERPDLDERKLAEAREILRHAEAEARTFGAHD
jgi:trimethylamine--corrinoid protein Co-methyltransferase